MHRNLIPRHESERIRQWQLDQVGTSNEIYHRNKEHTTYPECQRKRHTKMANLWIIYVEYKHERAHWWWSINGKTFIPFSVQQNRSLTREGPLKLKL